MSDLSGQILGVSQELMAVTQRFQIAAHPFFIIDILLVGILFYWIYLFLRETRAMRILYGILILGLLLLIGRLLNLTLLNFVMRYLVTSILIAIPVVFQPELRAALERLGRTRFVSPTFSSMRRNDTQSTIDTIVQTVLGLSRRKIGALLVLAGNTGLRDFIETGVELNADLSRELLWNIFTPNAPLHDGAVILVGNKIISAESRLPLSEEQFSEKLGTRHRAALGLTSQTDALVIVVSEETGQISVAHEGELKQNLTAETLAERLSQFYRPLIRKG